MNIITISREFGSGGREVGKRLADALEYAYMETKIHRCRERETNGMLCSDQEYEKKIRRVDKQRAKTYALLCLYPWGDVRGY